MNKALFSHKNDIWKTPRKIYRYFTEELNCYDPCPINPKEDGLKIDWKDYNFVNPPYSQISKWVDKAIIEHQKNHQVVLLVPARTDTKWFAKLYAYGCYFNFQKGRLHFDDGKEPAPFPSVFISLYGQGKSYIAVLDKDQLPITDKSFNYLRLMSVGI